MKTFLNIDQFSNTLNKIKKSKRSVVFTNGCFDLLHVGHLDYLQKTSLLGNILIVGLNSDDSIKRLKGNDRPIIPFEQRAKFLSFLPFIDYIIGFDEDTPIELIKKIKPDILVKGGDYSEDNIVGADFVKKNGGKVIIVPLIYNISSTSIMKKIRGEGK